MVVAARAALASLLLTAALALVTWSTTACCCGVQIKSGPPGSISGEVRYPDPLPTPATIYVIDLLQYQDTNRASYATVSLDLGNPTFSVSVPPGMYWVAAVTSDGRVGAVTFDSMCLRTDCGDNRGNHALFYFTIQPRQVAKHALVADWQVRPSDLEIVHLIISVPDPLPLGSPLSVPSGSPIQATASPYVPPSP